MKPMRLLDAIALTKSPLSIALIVALQKGCACSRLSERLRPDAISHASLLHGQLQVDTMS